MPRTSRLGQVLWELMRQIYDFVSCKFYFFGLSVGIYFENIRLYKISASQFWLVG